MRDLLRALRALLQKLIADRVDQAIARGFEQGGEHGVVQRDGPAVSLVEDVLLVEAKRGGLACGDQRS